MLCHFLENEKKNEQCVRIEMVGHSTVSKSEYILASLAII